MKDALGRRVVRAAVVAVDSASVAVDWVLYKVTGRGLWRRVEGAAE